MLLSKRHTYKPMKYPWAYDAWDKHEKMHWLKEEASLRDDIVDWSSKLTDSQKTLLTQIFRFFTQADCSVADGYATKFLPLFSGHPEIAMMMLGFGARECYDSQTEVLTDSGWKLFEDVSIALDRIAQYNIETREIEFVYATDYIRKPYTGLMHSYQNTSTDIVVTPNHRLVTINPHSRKYALKESSSGVWGGNFLYPKAGVKLHGRDSLTPLERLLIAVQADGTIRSLSGNYRTLENKTVDVSVKKARKVERMITLLTQCGLNCNPRYQENGFTKFTFTLPEIVDITQIKNMRFLDVLTLSHTGAREALEEVLFWDGSVTGSTKAYYNTNKEAIEVVQILSVFSDYNGHISINRPAGTYQVLNNPRPSVTKDCFVVSISDEVEKCYPYRTEVEYDGLVYCVTVPSGAVITRRNNKIAVCGNCIHIDAYSALIETVGMPETEYSVFLDYAAMKDKYDFLENVSTDNHSDIAKALAIYSAFTEGMQLFASFAMLMHFERLGVMRGMTNIIRWSIRDETVHAENMIRLYRTFLDEYFSDKPQFIHVLHSEIYTVAKTMVELEDKFIDLAFDQIGSDLNYNLPEGDEPLSKELLKRYIRHLTDVRLNQLGLKHIYGENTNPLPWLDRLLLAPEHTNFFEAMPTEYSRAGLDGEVSEW